VSFASTGTSTTEERAAVPSLARPLSVPGYQMSMKSPLYAAGMVVQKDLTWPGVLFPVPPPVPPVCVGLAVDVGLGVIVGAGDRVGVAVGSGEIVGFGEVVGTGGRV